MPYDTSQYDVDVYEGVQAPPPPPLGVDRGLYHTFSYGGSSVAFPDLLTPYGAKLGDFEMYNTRAGGYQSATGVVPATVDPTIVREGATWLVRNVESGHFIFGGVLTEPVEVNNQLIVSARGWGLDTEKLVERVLFGNMDASQWAPADQSPFPGADDENNEWNGAKRIEVKVTGNNLVFDVPRDSAFNRNDNGEPADWPSTPMVFWAPRTDLKWVHFKFSKRGRGFKFYDLELVGTGTGPTGNLHVIKKWNAEDISGKVSYVIPEDGWGGNGWPDMVGFRIVRKRPTRPSSPDDDQKGKVERTPHTRFILEDPQVGSVLGPLFTVPGLQGNPPGTIGFLPFTLNDAFTWLFEHMGVTTVEIANTRPNGEDLPDILPYDAALVSLPQVADDLAILGQWYWRIIADENGNPLGQAGPLGQHSWDVELEQTPVDLLPQQRFNVVQAPFRYGGGYESLLTVRADPDPFPGQDFVYNLELNEPPVKAVAEEFAEDVAFLVSQPIIAGQTTLREVVGPGGTEHADIVNPGDELSFENHSQVGFVEEVKVTPDGALNEVTLLDLPTRLNQLLAQRERFLNRGLSPDAATLRLTDPNIPATPTGISFSFFEEENNNGKRDWMMGIEWDLVTQDIDGEGTAVKEYIVRMIPYYKGTNEKVPWSDGGGKREHTVRAPKDDEDTGIESDPILDVPNNTQFHRLVKPHKFKYLAQIRAVDVLGQESAWSDEFGGVPALYSPPIPNILFFDLDPDEFEVRWTFPEDPSSPDEDVDDRVAYAQVEVALDSDFEHVVASSRKVDQEHFSRKLKRENMRRRKRERGITDPAMYAHVRSVDGWKAKSDWAAISALYGGPATPAIPTGNYFMSDGAKGKKLRLHVDYTDAYLQDVYEALTDANVEAIIYRVQVCDRDNRRQPIREFTRGQDAIRKRWVQLPEQVSTLVHPATFQAMDLKDETPGASWDVRRGLWYRWSARFRTHSGKLTPYSPWSGTVSTQVGHPNFGEGLGVKAVRPAERVLLPPGARNGSAIAPTPPSLKQTLKGVIVDWKWPQTVDLVDDPEIQRFRVQIAEFGGFANILDEVVVRNTRVRFDAGNDWPRRPNGTLKEVHARVQSLDELDNDSEYVVADGSGTISPEEGDGSIGPGTIDNLNQFARTIRPVLIWEQAALPGVPAAEYPEGSLLYWTTDFKLYRLKENAGSWTWTAEVAGGDITAGSITAGQIAAGAIGASQINAGTITADKLVSQFLWSKEFRLIEGGIFRTAASGSRIELKNVSNEDGAGPDLLRFINGGDGLATLTPRGFSGRETVYLERGSLRFGDSMLHSSPGALAGSIELAPLGAVPLAAAGVLLFYHNGDLKIRKPNGNQFLVLTGPP